MNAPAGLEPGNRFEEWTPGRVAYVVADVDGTLVGPSGDATDVVVAEVTKALEAGIAVGMATGRMRLAVEPLFARLSAPGPHILHNGAEVRYEARTVASWPLSDGHLAAVLDVARTLEIYAEIYVPDGFLVTVRDERARPHWQALGHEPLGVVTRTTEIHDEVLKATYALFDGVDVDGVVTALGQAGLKAGPATSPLTPDITYVNATRPDADKGRALQRAAEHLGYDLSATVAIGDAPNDIPMLDLVGTAVAMGAAAPAVKDAAHLVAPGVEEDGVAAVLEACRHGWGP